MSIIISDIYRPYVDFLISRGYKIAYKGNCANRMFGLPSLVDRCIIVGSKNSDNFLLRNLFVDRDEFVTPISLLYGKPFNKCKREFNAAMKGLGFSSDQIDKAYKYAMKSFDSALMSDYLEGFSLNNRQKYKFKDKSNSTKGLSIKDGEKYTPFKPYGHILSNHKKTYHHYGATRKCTIREIARLNGVPDDWSIDMKKYKNRDDFIHDIHNMISPYIIDKIWRRIY